MYGRYKRNARGFTGRVHNLYVKSTVMPSYHIEKETPADSRAGCITYTLKARLCQITIWQKNVRGFTGRVYNLYVESAVMPSYHIEKETPAGSRAGCITYTLKVRLCQITIWQKNARGFAGVFLIKIQIHRRGSGQRPQGA